MSHPSRMISKRCQGLIDGLMNCRNPPLSLPDFHDGFRSSGWLRLLGLRVETFYPIKVIPRCTNKYTRQVTPINDFQNSKRR
jgi:hypothetical protein